MITVQDILDIPELNLRLLAGSKAVGNPVELFGLNTIGLQRAGFSPQTMAAWSSIPGYLASLEKQNGEGAYRRLVDEATPLMPQMARMTRRIYDNLMVATGLRT